jgi:outer membrane protein TolC
MNRFGILAVFLLLGGCAHYRPAPVEPAATAEVLESRTLDALELREFIRANGIDGDWPRSSWDFDTLTLVAFYYHPDLDVARARWAVATAGQRTAAAPPNPILSITPGYNSTTRIPSPWFVTPALDIPIETAGKRGYRRSQAAQLSEAARLDIAAVAWQVRARLRRICVEAYLANETLVLRRGKVAAQGAVNRLLRAQLEAGSISALEVAQAESVLAQERMALQEAQGRLGELRVRLATALGLPVTALEGVDFSFDDLDRLPERPASVESRRQALLNRSDLLSALASYAAAESALQLEVAKQYPDVHLNPGYEFDQGDNKWMLGLSVTLPVLDRNLGPIAEAEARRAEAAARFLALQVGVLGEVDGAAAAYEAARVRAGEAELLMQAMEQQERAAASQLQAGEISRLELAKVQLQRDDARLMRLAARVVAMQALGDLEAALQVPAGLAGLVEASPGSFTLETQDEE